MGRLCTAVAQRVLATQACGCRVGVWSSSMHRREREMVRSHCVDNFVVGEGASGVTHGGATHCRERFTVAVNAAASCSMLAFEAHAARQGVTLLRRSYRRTWVRGRRWRGGPSCLSLSLSNPLYHVFLSLGRGTKSPSRHHNDPLWETNLLIAL